MAVTQGAAIFFVYELPLRGLTSLRDMSLQRKRKRMCFRKWP
jgi:hypothetical protein